jgi:hypothetical protein
VREHEDEVFRVAAALLAFKVLTAEKVQWAMAQTQIRGDTLEAATR